MKIHKTHSIAALFALLFSILLLSPPSYAIIRTVEGTVTRVSDGDTLQVITLEGNKLKIRLYGCIQCHQIGLPILKERHSRETI